MSALGPRERMVDGSPHGGAFVMDRLCSLVEHAVAARSEPHVEGYALIVIDCANPTIARINRRRCHVIAVLYV